MPFPYTLPTTSSVLLSDFFDSVTHPSLPLAATTKRSVLKDVLKKHKRLSPQARTTNLSAVQNAIKDYLPYLLTLNAGSGYRDLGPEKLDVEIKRPLEVEWRSTLSASLPGRENARPKLTGLHHEIAFTLSALAYTHSLLARSSLRPLYGTAVLTSDQRTSAIAIAMKHLMEAHSIHTYLLSLPTISAAAQDSPIDIQPSTISALASLVLAEATIIVVSKDDPYSAAVADDRNASNTDWMFKAPTIPKVRAHLYARFCLAAAEHATSASGLLSRSGGSSITTNPSSKIDDSLTKYTLNLRRTARSKAARFLAIDADLSGKTGEALAYLRGARSELGLPVTTTSTSRKGLSGLKQTFLERREDRKADLSSLSSSSSISFSSPSSSNSDTWGLDAGRFEETRVIEYLEAKWDKENSTVNVQVIPPFEPLIANMPSGREYHTPQPYQPPTLDVDVLVRMRAPPEPEERAFRGEEDDSGDENLVYGQQQPVGAFPGTAATYGGGRSATSNSYY